MALKTLFAKYRSQLVYAFLALAVMVPLLKPGFVLTLDMVFTPHIRLPDATTSSYLFYAVLHYLNLVVPSDVLQKIVLFTTLCASGIGMHRLIRYVDGERGIRATGYAAWGVYVGGALYMINPYVYSRFMAGQFAVLLGYCMLPFFVRSLLELLRRPSWQGSFVFAAWVVAIGIVSIHTLGLVGILCIVGLALAVWRNRRDIGRILGLLKFFGISLAVAVAASSYWLVPMVLGRSAASQAIAGFGAGDEQAFATLGGTVAGKLAAVLRLQGFWAEGHGLFALPQTHMIGWGLVVLVLWALIAAGVVSIWRRHERFVAVLLLVGAGAGILLAANIFNAGLNRILPFFDGFREPHKFVGLVALAYAFFAGQGAYAVLSRYERMGQRLRLSAALSTVLLLPVLVTPTMFWGFGGQLHATQYPDAWYSMNERLNQDPSDYQVLFLPWHLYMDYDFAGRIIANPAPHFFDKPVIASNQPELEGASPTLLDAQNTLLDRRILPKAAEGTRLGAQLAELRIKYVLLDKDDDYRTYDYLDNQLDLRLLSQNDSFKLYQNTAYGAKK